MGFSAVSKLAMPHKMFAETPVVSVLLCIFNLFYIAIQQRCQNVANVKQHLIPLPMIYSPFLSRNTHTEFLMTANPALNIIFRFCSTCHTRDPTVSNHMRLLSSCFTKKIIDILFNSCCKQDTGLLCRNYKLISGLGCFNSNFNSGDKKLLTKSKTPVTFYPVQFFSLILQKPLW